MISHPSLAAEQAAAERANRQHSPIIRRERVAADEARQRAESLALRAHASVFAVGMTVIVGVNLVTNLMAGIAGSWSAWWSLWALLGWGVGGAIHGLVVWLHRPSLRAREIDGDAA